MQCIRVTTPLTWLLSVFAIIIGFSNIAAGLECYTCKGINCQRPSKVNETTVCANKWDECVTIFSGLSVIERGCFTSIPEEHLKRCTDGPISKECHMCFGNLCNNRGAATCIHCSAKNNKECLEYHCPVPEGDNTYCYYRSLANGRSESGCLARLEDQLKCQQDNQCEMCLSTPDRACNGGMIPSTSSGANQIFANSLFIIVIFALCSLFTKL
ncbi:uncharacterized protein LOC131804093 [Musca domestica]|uniref:Uncharacterized protein LOC131804093 n=1 Tax=Musca domestica TaxID=7370 RepID=A0A1I8MG98_MUSDO|nr:uncharacterized protein LOC131804093 [Musca domestica]